MKQTATQPRVGEHMLVLTAIKFLTCRISMELYL